MFCPPQLGDMSSLKHHRLGNVQRDARAALRIGWLPRSCDELWELPSARLLFLDAEGNFAESGMQHCIHGDQTVCNG